MKASAGHRVRAAVYTNPPNTLSASASATRGAVASAAIVLVALLLTALLGGCGSGPATTPTRTTTSAARSSATAAGATTGTGAVSLPSGRANATAPAPATSATLPVPVRVSIPAIHVTSALQPLGLAKDGSLEPPSAWQVAGWYAGGVRPGEVGPAVIAGHVDSVNGPAVFYQLGRLRVGDTATVTLRGGRVLHFQVDGIARYVKARFPTAAVYGPTAVPVLRLITCTGDFDRAKHSYVDNLVVTTHLVS